MFETTDTLRLRLRQKNVISHHDAKGPGFNSQNRDSASCLRGNTYISTIVRIIALSHSCIITERPFHSTSRARANFALAGRRSWHHFPARAVCCTHSSAQVCQYTMFLSACPSFACRISALGIPAHAHRRKSKRAHCAVWECHCP